MSTTTTASNTAPLYVQFCAALRAEADKLGIKYETADTETGLPQNDGYAFFRSAPGAAALIIPKGKTRMGNLHSHVDLSGKDGYVALPKKSGKVICHFAPDLSKASAVLSAFSGAAKRPTLAPTPKRIVVSTPSTTPVTDVFCGLADSLPASEPAQTEEEAIADLYASEEAEENNLEQA